VAFVVLLKEERLSIEECAGSEVFTRAAEKDAGICGVFEDEEGARRRLRELKEEQQRLWR
jgi:hypothetical protein